MAEALAAEDEIQRRLQRLHAWAAMRHDQDTREAAGTSLFEQARGVAARVAEALAFVQPELVALPAEQLAGYAEHPALAAYRRSLRELLRLRAHVLPAPAEQALAALSPVLQGARAAFGQLSDADLRFPDVRDAQGVAHPLSHARYNHYLHARDRQLRQAAYLELHRQYEAHCNTCAATL